VTPSPALLALQKDPSVRMAPIPKESAPAKIASAQLAQPVGPTPKAAVTPSPALLALQKDPSVRMAPIPVETAPAAKPVTVAKAAPAPVQAPAPSKVAEATPKAKPEAPKAQANAKEAKPLQKVAQEEKLTRLRPALSDVVASRR
jgi:hypothetical protein